MQVTWFIAATNAPQASGPTTKGEDAMTQSNRRMLAFGLITLGFTGELAAIWLMMTAMDAKAAVPQGILLLILGLGIVFAGIALLRGRGKPDPV